MYHFTYAKIMKKDKTIVIKGWFLCPLDTKKVSTFWQVDTFLLDFSRKVDSFCFSTG